MPSSKATPPSSGSSTGQEPQGCEAPRVLLGGAHQMRSRNLRREEPLAVHLPDPVISTEPGIQPEEQALLADSVGRADRRDRRSGAPAPDLGTGQRVRSG
jgi:hypothetical protein